MNTLKKLFLGLEKKYKRAAIASPIIIIGEVVLEVFIPLIMARIIDTGIKNHDVAYVIKMGALMVGAALLSLSFGIGAARMAAVAALGFARNVRRRLFNKVQDFAFANVDNFSTASLVTRLTTDVTNTQNTFQMIIRMCVRAPFMFVSAIVMSLYINRELSIVFLVAIPLIAIPLVFIMRAAFPKFQIMMKKYDALNASVQENVTGIRAIKAFVRENHESDKFRSAADALRLAQVKAERIVIFNMPLMQIVMYLGITAMLWFGGNLIISERMQTGELISFITYLMQILMSLMMISMIFVMLVISKASIFRIIEVLDEDVAIKNPTCKNDALAENVCAQKNPAQKDLNVPQQNNLSAQSNQVQTVPCNQVKNGAIKFDNVSFSYDGLMQNAVLKNITLDIPSGATIGIVGATGSSKTTLVQLIARLYDVIEGSITVGGVDVRDYQLDVLRNACAMVLQRNVLFSGTIRENLLWGNENATMQEIEDACKASCAYNFVTNLPDGFETNLGQGGVNLSGGQKQRLCIARALLKKPKILILDDSTSAVDTATDAKIRTALKNLLPETTKIIIAQRLVSVQNADCIIVLEEGEVNGMGTHQELLATNAIYREVYESQQKNGGDMDAKESD